MTKTNGQPSPNLEQRLRAAAGDVEVELKRLITYVNDEVVPDVRRNGSHALRVASVELEKLAHQASQCR